MVRLPVNLWGEAALTVCYLWNRSTSRTLPSDVTPYEMVNGQKPDLLHLRVFGSQCFTRIPTELQTKLGPHSRHAIFVGYPDGTKGYHLQDSNGTFFTAHDVIFDECFPTINPGSQDSDSNDEVPMTPASLPSAATPVTHPLQHPSQLTLVPA